MLAIHGVYAPLLSSPTHDRSRRRTPVPYLVLRPAAADLFHADVVGPPVRHRRHTNADGGRGLADVRPDRQRLGPGPGGAVPVPAGPAADPGGRACGGPVPPGAHRGLLPAAADVGRCCAAAVHPRSLGVALAAAGPVGGTGHGPRLPDARAAGADALAGATRHAAPRHGLQLGRHAGGHHRWAGAGRADLRGGRLGGVRGVCGPVRRRQPAGVSGALPACGGGPGAGHGGHLVGWCAFYLGPQTGAGRRVA